MMPLRRRRGCRIGRAVRSGRPPGVGGWARVRPPAPATGLLILAAVGLAQVLVTLDYFSLTVAIPQMADDLDVSTTDIQWALTGYLLSFAALMVAGGRIGDILGRKRTLLIGIAVFGGASLLCGLAYDEYMLVACRVLQGIGAAILFPTSMGVVGNSFDDETRPRAIGVVVLVSTVGTALGPLVGGVLTDVLDWRWVFLVNVPFAILAAAMVMIFVSESRDESASRHVDYRGVVTLSAAIVAVTLAIDRGPSWIESEPGGARSAAWPRRSCCWPSSCGWSGASRARSWTCPPSAATRSSWSRSAAASRTSSGPCRSSSRRSGSRT